MDNFDTDILRYSKKQMISELKHIINNLQQLQRSLYYSKLSNKIDKLYKKTEA